MSLDNLEKAFSLGAEERIWGYDESLVVFLL